MLWSIVASWITVGIIVPVLIGIGVGVLSMGPPDFTVAKVCFTVSSLVLIFRVGWWLGVERPPGTKPAEAVAFAFLIMGGIAALWIASLIWVDGRKAHTEQSAATQESGGNAVAEADPRIQFTASPLWNDARKAAVREQIHSFDRYLSRIGITPPALVPLFRITEGNDLSFVFISPGEPPFDQRQIPVSTQLLTPSSIRNGYALYVFDSILSPHWPPNQSYMVQASWIYSNYFTASSLDVAPKTMSGWTAALWDVRQQLGSDFTDRALAWGIKAPTEKSADLNEYLGLRFGAGVLVVKNDLTDCSKVAEILRSHGLIPPLQRTAK